MNEKQYEKISQPFRNESKRKVLIIVNKIFTMIGFIAYPLLLLYIVIYERNQIIRFVLIPGVGFLVLTLIRKIINRKRPYEALEIKPLIHKDKQGNSMPSRHVFSLTIIALSWFVISPIVGNFLLMGAIIMGLTRVIGGVHYMSDVVVGFIIALLWGLLYFL